VKTFGASIFCRECNAQPYPDPGSGHRETFDLAKVDDVWCCEEHRPRRVKRASHVAAVTPAEAVDLLEKILADELAGLAEAITNDGREDIAHALEAYGKAVERALGDLRKAQR
jgi:hypothetical protein